MQQQNNYGKNFEKITAQEINNSTSLKMVTFKTLTDAYEVFAKKCCRNQTQYFQNSPNKKLLLQTTARILLFIIYRKKEMNSLCIYVRIHTTCAHTCIFMSTKIRNYLYTYIHLNMNNIQHVHKSKTIENQHWLGRERRRITEYHR